MLLLSSLLDSLLRKMKILVLTPVWKRPEITELYCLGILRLKRKFDIDVLCVCSPEDPTHNTLILDKYKIPYVLHENKLGKKKNFGLQEALKKDWDYLLEMNSDDIIKDELIEVYAKLMEQGVPFIGMGNFVFYNSETGESKECTFRDSHTVFGIGRAYKRDVVEGKKLWDDEADRGMDNHSERVLMKDKVYARITTTEEPLAFDIKSNVNLWSYKQMPGKPYLTGKLFMGLSDAEKEHLNGLRKNY